MAKRRTTIGDNPFDLLMSRQASPSVGLVEKEEEATPQNIEALNAKKRITISIDSGLLERVKNAVYWTPGLTLTGLAEGALDTAITELERKRGNEFPERKDELKRGRPLAS